MRAANRTYCIPNEMAENLYKLFKAEQEQEKIGSAILSPIQSTED
jgi:hypothetical protein